MLQDFRDQKNNPIIAVLFGIIILVFVLMFGLPSARDSCVSQKNVNIATVNGENIGQELTRSMIMRHYGDDVFGTQRYPVVMNQVADGIATIYLLADEARKAGLRVSDEELYDYIQNWEAGNPDVRELGFLFKNKFLQKSYENALNRYSMSSQAYKDYKRKELLARRYLILMQSSLSVSDESLWQEFARANETAAIEAIRLTPEAIAATLQPLNDAEISAFEASGSEEIQQYYAAHMGDYTTPAKVKMQQITIQKDLSKLTPGAKTDKTYTPVSRFNLTKAAAKDDPDHFDQIFDDYDETDNKDAKGVTGLFDINMMDEQLQEAVSDREVGDVFAVELSNRYVVGKVLEKTEEIVRPLDEVKHEIAGKILDDRRIKSRTDEVAAAIISKANGGASLEDALNEALYANVLAEQPMMAVDTDENAEDNADASADADTESEAVAEENAAEPAEAAEPLMVAVPTELPIIPESSRIKVQSIAEVNTDSGFIVGLNVINDDLSRDIRNSAANTLLPKTYSADNDTIIAKVISKKEASRDAFALQLPLLREAAIQRKGASLIGDINGMLRLQGGYGVWVEQVRSNAKTSGAFTMNEGYLAKVRDEYANAKRK